MSDAILKNKKPNFNKLIEFGFTESNGDYSYLTNIANNQFQMTVTVSKDETVSTQVIDLSLNEEYVLHRTAGACGAFVGMVRTDYSNVLQGISDKCFEPDVFKSDYAQKIVQYVRNTYHDELEFLWPRFPNNAIFRRKDTGKWYGALLVLSKRKLGLDSDDIIDIIDLRIEPENIDSLIDNARFFPGYHMNKRHWYTICLDRSVPIDDIYQRIDASYKLARK